MTAQEAQLKAQQQQQQNNAAMLMQQRMNMKGASIFCLNTFAENLSAFSNVRASLASALHFLIWTHPSSLALVCIDTDHV